MALQAPPKKAPAKNGPSKKGGPRKAAKKSAALPASLGDLKHPAYNPRDLSEEAAEGLRASLERFGDLSGLTWNRRTGHLVCGNQRFDQLRALHRNDLKIEAAGDDCALVAPGGQRYRVRVVDWDDDMEKAANIAANSELIQGTWDNKKLETLVHELKPRLDAPLFAAVRLDDMLARFPKAAPSYAPGDGFSADDMPPAAAPPPDPETDDDFADAPEDTFETGGHVRMVQLFLTDESIEGFQARVSKIRQAEGLESLTDAVVFAVERAAAALAD